MTKTFTVSTFRSNRNIAYPGQPELLAPCRRIELRFYWDYSWSKKETDAAFTASENEARSLIAPPFEDLVSRIGSNRNGMFIGVGVITLEKDLNANIEALKAKGFKQGT